MWARGCEQETMMRRVWQNLCKNIEYGFLGWFMAARRSDLQDGWLSLESFILTIISNFQTQGIVKTFHMLVSGSLFHVSESCAFWTLCALHQWHSASFIPSQIQPWGGALLVFPSSFCSPFLSWSQQLNSGSVPTTCRNLTLRKHQTRDWCTISNW